MEDLEDVTIPSLNTLDNVYEEVSDHFFEND